ncbi:hypothetical protein [Actinophytocola gossypii]|uniref:Integral membrane protein n=1 Tax=Actinophytocola gossypii TaxID=2812003 RepID=A0ABT2JI06_9PSEU|nr:hypothetical protein [Actinophytocola gossypii]MCT2587149.1 hypothetical protein [Actinophytocola gossypii]
MSEATLARRTRSGPGRLLIAVYAVFAIAASSRSAVQLGTRFEEAPLAYVLSAFAAVVYVLATACLAMGSRASRRVALAAVSVELVGVLVVGTASLVAPRAFPDATVWSDFGAGYLFVPVVLPLLGLWWLRTTAHTPA